MWKLTLRRGYFRVSGPPLSNGTAAHTTSSVFIKTRVWFPKSHTRFNKDTCEIEARMLRTNQLFTWIHLKYRNQNVVPNFVW